MANPGVTGMNLQDVVEQAQFAEYYKSHGLQSTEDKINNLKKVMKIRAMQCDEVEPQGTVLSGLEEVALRGFWKASWS